MTRIVAIVAFGLACLVEASAAERPEVREIVQTFREVRPVAADLELYQLDWAPTLDAAKQRAAKEGRPIFLIIVTNSFGDIASGHC